MFVIGVILFYQLYTPSMCEHNYHIHSMVIDTRAKIEKENTKRNIHNYRTHNLELVEIQGPNKALSYSTRMMVNGGLAKVSELATAAHAGHVSAPCVLRVPNMWQ